MLLFSVALIALSVHVFFAAFFFVVGSKLLFVCHSIGIFVFIIARILLAKHHYDLAGVIITSMIILTSLASIFIVGGDNFTMLYLYITLVMMLVVPYNNKNIPLCFCIALPFLMLGAYLFSLSHQPLQSIGAANKVFAVLNIIVNAGGIIFLLSLEQLVRSFVDSFHQQRVEILQNQAYRDALTKLRNRRFTDDYFAALALAPPPDPVCIAIADLDNFKVVNDTYGHDAGDFTLTTISDLFVSNTRKNDLVVRWGGEEFLLILQDTTLEDAAQTLDKIRLKVASQELVYERYRFFITLTIGLAPLDPTDIAGSLELCDQKLYHGKNSGKNKVVL